MSGVFFLHILLRQMRCVDQLRLIYGRSSRYHGYQGLGGNFQFDPQQQEA